LYDKVELYDSLKHIMQGHGWTDHISTVQNGLRDIEHNMLHFLENHDEQRIASPDFVGEAEVGKPAMVLSATISTSPTMIYFGQEVGEPGAENAGFGQPTRTSIFDYIGVPNHQRWLNNKQFDGGQLSKEEADLRDFYKRLLNVTIDHKAFVGEWRDIHYFNKERTENYNHRVYSYLRWKDDEKLIVIINFDKEKSYDLNVKIPQDIVDHWQLVNKSYKLEDLLYQKENTLNIDEIGSVNVRLNPLESVIYKIE